jgi:hypothetical protein
VKVVLEVIAGNCRVVDACKKLNLSEARFHQLKTEALAGAIAALEPGQAGRPARVLTPAEEQVRVLEHKLQEQAVELHAAQVREEIALVLPKVRHEPEGAEKKTPPPDRSRRRRGRKRNT